MAIKFYERTLIRLLRSVSFIYLLFLLIECIPRVFWIVAKYLEDCMRFCSNLLPMRKLPLVISFKNQLRPWRSQKARDYQDLRRVTLESLILPFKRVNVLDIKLSFKLSSDYLVADPALLFCQFQWKFMYIHKKFSFFSFMICGNFSCSENLPQSYYMAEILLDLIFDIESNLDPSTHLPMPIFEQI